MNRSFPTDGVAMRADTAYQALRQAIIEQALLPGAKLPEDEIGTHFGMSRTLVRNVLARLRAEGLVEAQTRRTATVAEPSLEEARDIFELRRVLEREAVRGVIKRWRPEFGATLEGLVRDENSARARGDQRVAVRLAGEFHIRLATLSGNKVLERYLSELVSRCSLILALYGRPHSSDCAIDEHTKIIEALRNGDADAAVATMDHHVLAVAERAMLAGSAETPADLRTVLARYGQALDTQRKAIPFAPSKSVAGKRKRAR